MERITSMGMEEGMTSAIAQMDSLPREGTTA